MEAPRLTLAGDVGCLNLTRAVGKLQSSHAHHATQNDLGHLTEARESLEMVASGVIVGKPSLHMRVAGGVSMITRAACMLGVSDAFQSKP